MIPLLASTSGRAYLNCALALCGGGLAALSHATPAVYEGFTNYTVGSDVLNRSGGTGFDSAWDLRYNLVGSGPGYPAGRTSTVLEDSLAYSDGLRTLVTEGGSLFITGEFGNVQLARKVDLTALPHQGDDPKFGKTTYLSFLVKRSGESADPTDPVYGGNYPYGDNLYPRAAGVNLFGIDDDAYRAMLFGNLSNKSDDFWRVTGQDLYGDERRDVRSPVRFGEGARTHFLVIRIDHGAGGWHADRLRLWINPNLAAERANAAPMTFDWTSRDDALYMQPAFIGIEAGDPNALRPHSELTFDEFRIGDSWAAVTPHTGGESWSQFPVLEGDFVAGGDGFLGWLSITDSPWSYSWILNQWIYLPTESHTESGAWFFIDPKLR